MWKYFTKKHNAKFLLSLNLIDNNWNDVKKLKCLYSFSNNIEKHYQRFSIRKQNGSSREILEPDFLLKHIQKNILNNILNYIPISKCAKAYYKGADIINNALPHLGQKIVLKMDIKDFFQNINYMMIYKNVFKSVYYPPSIKTLLVNMCCYEDYLPQGAPTSASISNIIMRPFDEYIYNWCYENNVVYTRYCDDLTFSGNFNPIIVQNKVSGFLGKMGFEINNAKTKIINKNRKQIVTGIVVNEKIQVQKNYRKKIRQEIYFCKKFGICSHLTRINYNNSIDTYLQSLLGKINYILHINPEDKEFACAKNYIIKEIKCL